MKNTTNNAKVVKVNKSNSKIGDLVMNHCPIVSYICNVICNVDSVLTIIPECCENVDDITRKEYLDNSIVEIAPDFTLKYKTAELIVKEILESIKHIADNLGESNSFTMFELSFLVMYLNFFNKHVGNYPSFQKFFMNDSQPIIYDTETFEKNMPYLKDFFIACCNELNVKVTFYKSEKYDENMVKFEF